MRIGNCKKCHAKYRAKTAWQLFCSSLCKQRSYRGSCIKCGAVTWRYSKTCMKCRPSRHTEAAFWAQVKKGPGCWVWQGTVNAQGYGRVRRGAIGGAHRVSWVIANGAIPDGMHICHKCDNPPCVRPDHLFAGTRSDNMKDCTSKGRNTGIEAGAMASRGDKHWTRRPESKGWLRKLSKNMKQEIAMGTRVVLRDLATGQIRGTRKFA